MRIGSSAIASGLTGGYGLGTGEAGSRTADASGDVGGALHARSSRHQLLPRGRL
jgi:hypothetical protein